jgi:hypothetical protein
MLLLWLFCFTRATGAFADWRVLFVGVSTDAPPFCTVWKQVLGNRFVTVDVARPASALRESVARLSRPRRRKGSYSFTKLVVVSYPSMMEGLQRSFVDCRYKP